jgi:hypothetical protein
MSAQSASHTAGPTDRGLVAAQQFLAQLKREWDDGAKADALSVLLR